MSTFALTPRTQQPLTVLVVEDAIADAELILLMLEDDLPDARVTAVASIAQAIDLLTEDIDVVVSDLSLPDAQGLDALHAIRAARADVPVVVMTGRDDRQLALSALSAGAEDYLVKGANTSRAVATAVLYAVQRRSHVLEVQRYERLALSLVDAMEAATCAVDSSANIIAISRAWVESADRVGADPASVGIGTNYIEICRQVGPPGATDAAATANGLRGVLTGELGRFQLDYPCHSPTEQRWFSLRINPLPEISGAVLTHIDVSDAKRGEVALEHQTLHDPLTGLPNRLLLNDRLEQALEQSGRGGLEVAVGFIDLDGFKAVNDSFGHRAGDELLRSVSARLTACIRGIDTLSRFAGDEFVAVWPAIESTSDAEQLAHRLRDAFLQPFAIEEVNLGVSASIGIAMGAPPLKADDLLVAADAAMYDAKANGRGLVRTYTAAMRETIAATLQEELDLRDGLSSGQFVVHYQPVVDLRLQEVTGVEALVRWHHPHGLRMPSEFIDTAERTSLIVPLGAWVLEEACRQAVIWSAAGVDLQMAVNLSGRQVSHPELISTISRVLEESQLAPERLILEVTESTVMEDSDLARVALSKIEDFGCTIAVDDFGTGYSSLLYLKRYPVKALKIDRSFVAGIGANHDDDAIVASIVSLARAVGADCIAEGVETADQRQSLQLLGCQFAQGFLFSEPVSAQDLLEAVERCNVLLSLPAPRAARSSRRLNPPVPSAVQDRIAVLHHSGASLHTIAAVLNRERVPHGRQVKWHSSEVARIVASLYRSPA